jgi:glycosyltransferase involved in cell wall biosynthesis
MEIIQISPSYKPAYQYGGPTMSISMLCEALQKAAVRTLVLTTTANGKFELDINRNGVTITDEVSVRYCRRLTKDHSHFSPALCIHLIRCILKNRYLGKQIIHIHSWWNLVAVLACLIAKINNSTVVLSPRGMLADYSFGNKNTLAKLILHGTIGKWLLNSCHIHATSNLEKDDILRFLRPRTITVIPNFVNFPAMEASRKPEEKNSRFKLLFLSRIDKKKNLELLFHTLAELTSDCELTIAGTGELSYIEALKNLASALNISKRILWTGHVGNDDKFQVLMNHDLLVLPSYNENFANVVVESLAMGTAVLVSGQVGLASYVKMHKLGWVSQLTQREFTKHLNHIPRYGNALAKIRSIAPGRIAADFDGSVLVQRYLSMYTRISG